MGRRLPLSRVLRLALDPVQVQPDTLYPMCGVYGFGRGIILREPVLGRDMSARTLFRLRAGQFVYSRLKAFEGAFCLVPDAADGRFVTNEFPVFDIDTSLADPAYLDWSFRRPAIWNELRGQSTGTIKRRERLQAEDLLDFAMDLPPLDEQQHIVDLLTRAGGIRRLRERAVLTARDTTLALFNSLFGDLQDNLHAFLTVDLDRVSEISSGLTKGRKLNGELTEETPYMRVANVQDGHLDVSEVKTIPATARDRERYALRPGDLLLTEGGDPDKLGRGALWTGAIPGCLHQNHVFRVRADQRRVLPDYLAAVTASHYGKAYFLRVAKRTTGIASINRSQLGAFPVPVPPLDLQRRFAERLADLRGIITQQEKALALARETERALMARLLG